MRCFSSVRSTPNSRSRKAGRLFELFPFSCRFHVLSQAVQQFPVPTFKKLAHLVDDQVIVFADWLPVHGAMHRLISNSMQARSARPSISMSQVARGTLCE